MPDDASASPITTLQQQGRMLLDRAHVPYSGDPASALVLLDDGQWIPGVRIESASFSLSLRAVTNAVTTAFALGRSDAIAAVVLNRKARPEEKQYLGSLPSAPFAQVAPEAFVQSRYQANASSRLPSPEGPLSSTLGAPIETPQDGVTQARQIAGQAYVPTSRFPVGALLQTADDAHIPGVNVEHSDWAHIVCAERNALGTLYSYGHPPPSALYLSCPLDSQSTPCGACRQWLAELVPDIDVWMDRDASAPECSTPSDLLPGSFSGQAIPHSPEPSSPYGH